MVGVNLREETMEVAFEQQTERNFSEKFLLGSDAVPALKGSSMEAIVRAGRVQREIFEVRW